MTPIHPKKDPTRLETDRLTIMPNGEPLQHVEVDRLGNEVHAAIQTHRIDTAWVKGVQNRVVPIGSIGSPRLNNV